LFNLNDIKFISFLSFFIILLIDVICLFIDTFLILAVGCTGIWRKEGIRGFYRGLWPNYIKVVPSIAITFLVYEQLKRLFKI
jgi:hypothetical protein